MELNKDFQEISSYMKNKRQNIRMESRQACNTRVYKSD